MADKNKPAPATATTAGDAAEKVKTPKERMQTTGVNRVNAVLDSLRILSNVSDKATYEYNTSDWAKIKAAIDGKWAEVQVSFDDALAGKSKKTVKQGFGL